MTPEESARASIDALLVAAGWTIHTRDTINLSAACVEAITQNGEADYCASVLRAACEGRLVPTEAELARNDSRIAGSTPVGHFPSNPDQRVWGSIPYRCPTPDFESGAMLLPPLAEQKRIVAEVERRLSVIDELEASVTANLARGSSLRCSILMRYFGSR